MQQNQSQTLSQRFQQYRPSKTALFWSCGGCVVLATVVGFSWGGWTTGGSAQDMADKAAASARQELAAVVCVDRFMAAQDADVQLTALKEITSSYAQSKFVEEGGWAIIVPASNTTDYKAGADDRKAAGLCAEELSKREIPTPPETAALVDDEAVVAQ
jgi:RNA 3'-terminal phosphate cyclase